MSYVTFEAAANVTCDVIWLLFMSHVTSQESHVTSCDVISMSYDITFPSHSGHHTLWTASECHMWCHMMSFWDHMTWHSWCDGAALAGSVPPPVKWSRAGLFMLCIKHISCLYNTMAVTHANPVYMSHVMSYDTKMTSYDVTCDFWVALKCHMWCHMTLFNVACYSESAL